MPQSGEEFRTMSGQTRESAFSGKTLLRVAGIAFLSLIVLPIAAVLAIEPSDDVIVVGAAIWCGFCLLVFLWWSFRHAKVTWRGVGNSINVTFRGCLKFIKALPVIVLVVVVLAVVLRFTGIALHWFIYTALPLLILLAMIFFAGMTILGVASFISTCRRDSPGRDGELNTIAKLTAGCALVFAILCWLVGPKATAGFFHLSGQVLELIHHVRESLF
jgi:hypothetical protein